VPPGFVWELCDAARLARFRERAKPVLASLFCYEGASADLHGLQTTSSDFFVNRCASDTVSAAKIVDAECAVVHLGLLRPLVDADVTPDSSPEKHA